MQPIAWLPAPPLQGGQSGSRAGSCPAPAHHVAVEPATVETDVPLTVQHLHLRLLVLNTFTLRRSEGESIQHRQREMKMLGRERCIQLRKRGQRGCRPFVASP